MRSPSSLYRLSLRPTFDSSNLYGIPDLRGDRLACVGDDSEVLAYGCNASTKHDTAGKVLCFFVDDYRFQNLWNYYDRTVTSILRLRFAAVCEPDFSLWSDRPMAEQIFATYQTRWIGRYMQERGIDVIPTLNWSTSDSYVFAWCGIPKNPPLAAIESRSCGASHDAFNEGLQAACESVNPSRLMVYGEPQPWLRIPVDHFFVPPPTIKRLRRIKNGRKGRSDAV